MSSDARFEKCDCCNGYGAVPGYAVTVYETGCAFPYDEATEEPCPECGGTGETETVVEPVTLDDLQ
jgi:DnaJ-class molecular chaperone